MTLFRKRTQISGQSASKAAKRKAEAVRQVQQPRLRPSFEKYRTPDAELDDDQSLAKIIPQLARALAQGEVVDLVLPGAEVALELDGITNVLAILLDPAHPDITLRSLPSGRNFILVRNLLQQLKDYRSLLRTAFDRLAVGGWLVLTVPHQFLAERKYRLPSRYHSKGLRFYTPASLMAEIEEALDPTRYRIRLLKDDDQAFDYDLPIEERPEGHKRIIVAIQKVARPPWADKMDVGDLVEIEPRRDSPVLPIDAGRTVTHVLGTTRALVGRILVIKLDHRGDYLMALPAFRQLRSYFPDAHITLACGSWNTDVARSSGMFDAVLALDFFAEDASASRDPPRDLVKRQFAKIMKGETFDVVMDLRFFDDTRDLIKSVNARHRAGFDSWDNFPWLDIKLSLPSPTLSGRAIQQSWSAAAFSCAEANRRDNSIRCAPAPVYKPNAVAAWGPYATLDQGSYELALRIDGPGRQRLIRVDIVCDRAQTTLFHGDVEVGARGEALINVHLASRADDVEVRIYCPRFYQSAFYFRGVRYQRAGVIVGVHQRESMLLLVELMTMRLRLPYMDEIQADMAVQ